MLRRVSFGDAGNSPGRYATEVVDVPSHSKRTSREADVGSSRTRVWMAAVRPVRQSRNGESISARSQSAGLGQMCVHTRGQCIAGFRRSVGRSGGGRVSLAVRGWGPAVTAGHGRSAAVGADPARSRLRYPVFLQRIRRFARRGTSRAVGRRLARRGQGGQWASLRTCAKGMPGGRAARPTVGVTVTMPWDRAGVTKGHGDFRSVAPGARLRRGRIVGTRAQSGRRRRSSSIGLTSSLGADSPGGRQGLHPHAADPGPHRLAGGLPGRPFRRHSIHRQLGGSSTSSTIWATDGSRVLLRGGPCSRRGFSA